MDLNIQIGCTFVLGTILQEYKMDLRKVRKNSKAVNTKDKLLAKKILENYLRTLLGISESDPIPDCIDVEVDSEGFVKSVSAGNAE